MQKSLTGWPESATINASQQISSAELIINQAGQNIKGFKLNI
jgi:hypothetical protein